MVWQKQKTEYMFNRKGKETINSKFDKTLGNICMHPFHCKSQNIFLAF